MGRNMAAGKSSARKLFGIIDLVGSLTPGRALFLASLGVAVVALEQGFNWSLQLPGHHGLETMALLVLARLSCTNPWSATLVGASAAVAAPFLGASHGVLMPLFYVLPAVVLDLGYRLSPRFGKSLLFLPLFAALAYASKTGGSRAGEPAVRDAVRVAARRAGLPDRHPPAVRIPRRTRRGAGVAGDGKPTAAEVADFVGGRRLQQPVPVSFANDVP